MKSQKCRAKRLNSKKTGRVFCLIQVVPAATMVHTPKEEISDIDLGGPRASVGIRALLCQALSSCIYTYIKPAHAPSNLQSV